MEIEEEILLGTEEAARILHCSPPYLRSLVDRELLACVRLPGSRLLRFRPSALTELAKQMEIPALAISEQREIR